MDPLKIVNLYIETDFRGPRRQDGMVIYLLETQTAKGARTRDKMIAIPQTTEHHLVLEAMEEALDRINQSCQVEIYLCDRYIADVIEGGLLERWRINNWHTARGEPVKDADLWENIAGHLQKHLITIHLADYHGYRSWMQDQMKKYKRDQLIKGRK